DLFVAQTFNQLRVKHDDRTLDSPGKGVDDRILLHEQFGHVDAQGGAGDLEFGVKIRALLRSDFHGTGRKDYADGRFSGYGQQLLQRRIDTRYRSQSREGAPVIRVDILVLVQVCKFLVGRIGEWQPATTATRVAAVDTKLIALSAIAATNRSG